MLTNDYLLHRQQLRKQRPEFMLKTKYRREDTGENQLSYDWTAHREAVRRMNPRAYVENK